MLVWKAVRIAFLRSATNFNERCSNQRHLNINMKTNLLLAIVNLSLTFTAAAEPELKGTPSELSRYLQDVPIREAKTVSIAGEADLRVSADQAVVTLKVTRLNSSHE